MKTIWYFHNYALLLWKPWTAASYYGIPRLAIYYSARARKDVKRQTTNTVYNHSKLLCSAFRNDPKLPHSLRELRKLCSVRLEMTQMYCDSMGTDCKLQQLVCNVYMQSLMKCAMLEMYKDDGFKKYKSLETADLDKQMWQSPSE